MLHRRQFLSAAALTGAACAAPALLRAAPVAHPDLQLLDEVLTTLHPGLWRYLTKAQYAADLARLDTAWGQAPTLEGRYLALARFLSAVRCGHTQPNPYNQRRAVRTALFERADRLPFAFRWIDGAMVVTADHGGTGLQPGSVIRSINGQPAARILAQLLPCARADGSNDGKRRALLSVTGREDIATFDVLYGLHFGAPVGGQFQIECHAPGSGRLQRLTAQPISLAQRKSFIPRASTGPDGALWQFGTDPDGIATLTMDSWAMYNQSWNWAGWLDDRLTDCKGARGLIVDLRRNEGGNDCGNPILARLTDRPIALPPVRQLVRQQKIPARLNPVLDTWDARFRDWGDTVERVDSQFWQMKASGADAAIAPRSPRLTVPLAVLTSPQNSSATHQFASLVRSSGLGQLAGETTGGNRRGINGGAILFVRLPDSGLEFDLPLIGNYPHTRQPDAGVEPDIRISNSAAEIAAGRDRVLERARTALLNI